MSLASSWEEGAECPFSQGKSVFTISSSPEFLAPPQCDCRTAWLMWPSHGRVLVSPKACELSQHWDPATHSLSPALLAGPRELVQQGGWAGGLGLSRS